MEPISLIMAALTSTAVLKAAAQGAAHGITQGILQGTAQEAYHDLKALIKKKFAGKPKAEMVLEEHEQDPEAYEVPLKKKLLEVEADKDEAILRAAQELLKHLKPEESKAGKFNIKVQGDIKGIVGDISGGTVNQTIS